MLLGPLFIASDPAEVNIRERMEPISSAHWLGTDHLGRDIFSRILAGAQTTIGTSILILLISLAVGIPIGLLSGFFGGRIDRFLMRIVDTFMAFPDYIVAIVLSGLLGPGMVNLILAIVIVKWVGYARLVRSTVLGEKGKDYVALATLHGLSPFQILIKHMFPHIIGNVLVLATVDIGKIILMIASLSYIGLGAQPPTPEWGTMLNEGRAYFYNAPQLMYIPGIAIMVLVLLFNVIGDSLRDHFQVKG
ncbi:ABC transporter permease subunit [Priestia megaterium]|nr:ABC transporter permease subunit [Priestia megaterium]